MVLLELIMSLIFRFFFLVFSSVLWNSIIDKNNH